MEAWKRILALCLLLSSCQGHVKEVQQSMAGYQPPGVEQNSSVTEQRQSVGSFPMFGQRPNLMNQKKRCPLCDSSVYPYCGEKMLHDACCCTDPYVYQLPVQCNYADCRFLHANSCREHMLIANCCCSDDYRSLLKSN